MSFTDVVMVKAPGPGQTLHFRKQQGEKFYRYVCLEDYLADLSQDGTTVTVGLDPDETQYTVTPLLGQAAILVVVSVIDEDFNDPQVSGKPGTMLVLGDYGGGPNKEQLYTILCPCTDGQKREVSIYYSCVAS